MAIGRTVYQEDEVSLVAPPEGGLLLRPWPPKDRHRGRFVLRQYGSLHIFEAGLGDLDPADLAVTATQHRVMLSFPDSRTFLERMPRERLDDGRLRFVLKMQETVLPERVWVDAWEGVLRINIPVEDLTTEPKAEAAEARVILRNGPPPELPRTRIEPLRNPWLYLHDRGDRLEVEVTFDERPPADVRHDVRDDAFDIIYTQVDEYPKGDRRSKRIGKRRITIRLPQRVSPSEVSSSQESLTFRFVLPKA